MSLSCKGCPGRERLPSELHSERASRALAVLSFAPRRPLLTDSSPPVDASLAAVLERIEQRLERIEQQVGVAGHLAGAAPATIAAAVDSLDGAVARLDARGVDVDARVRQLGALLEAMTAPDVLTNLQHTLQALATLPGTLAAAADSFDGLVARLAEAGIDVDERLTVLTGVAERLTAPEALEMVREFLSNVEAIHGLLSSGIFDEHAVHVVGQAAGALSQMDLKGVKPVGAFGALRALGNPCIQRSIGAAVEFGKLFGRTVHLKPGEAAPEGCPKP